MVRRSSIWLLAAALLVVAIGPAAIASTESIVPERLTFMTRDLTDREPSLGVFRGVYAEFRFGSFDSASISDTAGAVEVQLRDTRGRLVAAVSSRANAFDETEFGSLSVPIDSVWGTFDYDADGYWTQARNQRINGGNCEDIAYADVSVLVSGQLLTTTIPGPPNGSCDDIRP
jgi:hypothetical protein